MKYRRNKVKREHGIIHDALNWLEELSQCAEVTDIIPGVIEVSRSPEKGIVYKYQTQTGCKLLLKSNGSIQEAFVVTKNPEIVKNWVENRFPNSEKAEPDKLKKKENGEQNQQGKSNLSKTKGKGNGTRKKSYYGLSDCYTGWQANDMQSGNSNPANVGQLLNSDTRKALRALQKDLNPKHRLK